MHKVNNPATKRGNAHHAHGVRGRFAPSPSGRMHAGNIYAALIGWLFVKQRDGSIVLRIEDLDPARSKREFADAIMRDFELLGLTWDEGPYYQSNRTQAYNEAYEQLASHGHIYPCFCTRADIAAAQAPHAADYSLYPGTCRNLDVTEQARRLEELAAQNRQPSYRLALPDEEYVVDDYLQGSFTARLDRDCGDVVVKRSDGGFAYNFAVVVDDDEQGITCIVRGCDLLPSTPVQDYIRHILGLSEVHYAHIPLLVAPDGRRLSKRDKDASFESLLECYKSPEGILGHISYVAGLIDDDEAVTADTLLRFADISKLAHKQAIEWI